MLITVKYIIPGTYSFGAEKELIVIMHLGYCRVLCILIPIQSRVTLVYLPSTFLSLQFSTYEKNRIPMLHVTKLFQFASTWLC